MTAPFKGAHWTEVQIRVAYALVKYDYRHNPTRYRVPADGLADLARRVKAGRFGNISTFLLAWSVELQRSTKPLKKVVAGALSRAREGHTFRRCAFDAYKGSRRPDPRVTNRGVRVTVVVATDAQLNGSMEYAEGNDDV